MKSIELSSWSASISVLIVVIVLLTTSLFMGTTSAITNGQPDGDGHPAVCVVAAYDSEFHYLGFGSGTLISPDLVLTAGHVTALAYYTEVYFGEDVIGNPDWVVTGTSYTYPGLMIPESMAGGLFNFHGDVGVVQLLEPVPSSVVDPSDYGQLPTAGVVDTLGKKATMDIVGYGMQEMVTGEGAPYWDGFLTRYNSTCELINTKYVLGGEFMMLSSNPSKDKGATSYGDSGGPVFIHGTNMIVGITSFGPDYWCEAAWYAFRVDTAPVLSWVNSFLI